MRKAELNGSAAGPLRVLWLADSRASAEEDARVVTFQAALDPSRIRVDLLVLAKDGSRVDRPERVGRSLPKAPEGVGASGPMHLPGFLRLRGRLRERPYDLVHAHGHWSSFWAAVTGGRLGVPMVASLYRNLGSGAEPSESPLQRRAYRSLRRRARRLVTLSGSERDRYVRDGTFSRTQLEVVHPGVPLPRSARKRKDEASWLRDRAGFPTGGPIVVTTASMDRLESGLDVLIRAVPGIVELVPQARFVLVGNGVLRGELERRARARGFSQYLHWAEPDDALARILAGADLFVDPALRNPVMADVMDAMAAGLPTVATRVGGVPEILGSEAVGRLVPPADPDALAAAVVALLQNPGSLAEMCAAAHQRARDRFSAGMWVERMEAVYREVVEESRSGAPYPDWTYGRLSVKLLNPRMAS